MADPVFNKTKNQLSLDFFNRMSVAIGLNVCDNLEYSRSQVLWKFKRNPELIASRDKIIADCLKSLRPEVMIRLRHVIDDFRVDLSRTMSWPKRKRSLKDCSKMVSKNAKHAEGRNCLKPDFKIQFLQ